MCGIMGIINKKGNAIKKVIEGLEKILMIWHKLIKKLLFLYLELMIY